MVLAIERKADQSVLDHGQNEANVTQMKGRCGQNGFAGEQRFSNTTSEAQRPSMVLIIAIGKGDKESRIRIGRSL
jgi:hypothetical protein